MAKKSNVNKVSANPNETTTDKAKDKKDKKEKGRVAFPILNAMYRDGESNVVTAINGDNVLIAVPVPIKDDSGKVIYAGYNTRKHLPLKKADFASLATHLRFSAFVSRMKALASIKRAEELEGKATRIEQYGDESTRKKVAKLVRMRAAAEKIQKALEDEGVDLSGTDTGGDNIENAVS